MGTHRDPFDVPLVLLRVGWMDRYEGVGRGDDIARGGAYVEEHGFGHEVFNFRRFGGRVFGYVRPPGRREDWSDAKIDITRLGAAWDAESVDGVLAVWVATAAAGGAYVVGWYRNATVYRNWQAPPPGSGRRHGREQCEYYLGANADDAVLLPAHERTHPIPQSTAGGFGKSNVFSADDPAKHRRLRQDLMLYVATGKMPKRAGRALPRQPDPFLRRKVEDAAVEVTTAYFADRLGYGVSSVEGDNCGWDLNAVLGSRFYRLEVKGLSGPETVVELTPNEYAAINRHRDSYRICVVTNALTDPCLEVFAYYPDAATWESTLTPGRTLIIQEIVAARCSAT